MKRILFLALAASAFSQGFLLAQQPTAPRLTADAVHEIGMRNIPGTFTSGRIADVAVDPKNRNIWYVATASGGLWKTTNRGVTFQPIFDDSGSYSLGSVTVDPKNSDVIWLGTGENESQRAIGWGDGVYKSVDAGKTWKNVGLKNSEHIARILVDPRDSNVVYVASQGPLFSPGGDRGLYKTTDGGATWKPILEISQNTGITDIDIDPRNPDVMYAAAYQRRRNTSVIVAGGPDAAIFKTTDGGMTWKKLTQGLPGVDLGRIALAVSPQKPDVVYALIMTARSNKMSGFYRSDDGGEHWTRGAYKEVQDPEYYGEIFADPFQFDRVYAMDVNVFVTEDGGKTDANCLRRRRGRGLGLHSDNHALVFDPTDQNHLIEGNDGGLYESYDHGRTWRHFNNIPVTQFYRVSVDNGLPFYNIYGGTQDNGSQGVPSRTVDAAGIRTSDWMVTGGGDGYQSRADQEDASIVYTCSQQINCVRLDLKTGRSTSINPRAGRGGANGQKPTGKVDDPKLRSRWDIPFIISPHNRARLYIMGNRLMRSDDSGATWREVSDDLTRNIDRDTLPVMGKVWGPDAVWKNEFTDEYGTGTALAESPLKEGLLFGRHRRRPGADFRRRFQDLAQSGPMARRARHDLRDRRAPFAGRRKHALRHAQRFSAREFQALRDEEQRPGPHLDVHRGRPAERRSGLDHRAGPRQPRPAVRGHGVRPFVHRGWRRALDQDSQRHAAHPHPRSGNPEARERPGGGFVRARVLRAGRLFGAAAAYSGSTPVGRCAVRARPQGEGLRRTGLYTARGRQYRLAESAFRRDQSA